MISKELILNTYPFDGGVTQSVARRAICKKEKNLGYFLKYTMTSKNEKPATQ